MKDVVPPPPPIGILRDWPCPEMELVFMLPKPFLLRGGLFCFDPKRTFGGDADIAVIIVGDVVGGLVVVLTVVVEMVGGGPHIRSAKK